MRKDSANLLGATLLVTAAIISGAYYLFEVQRVAQAPTGETGWQTLLPSALNKRRADSTGSIDKNVSAETSDQRTDSILTCEHPEYGTVYTNAASCNEADVHNRISIAEPLLQTPGQDQYSGNTYQTPQNEAGNSRTERRNQQQNKPNLRLDGKSPPNGLNVSCKNSVGKALEIERDLAATDNPRESAWRDSYCKQRCEAIQEACPVADDYYYYRFNNLCRGSEYYPCYPEHK